MTTTDARRAARPRRRSGVDLRPHLTALLATAYLIGWWAFGARPPKPAPPVEAPPEVATEGRGRVAVWYADLPPEQRPKVELPPGLHIVEAANPVGPAVREAVLSPVRAAPRARRGRIRTRSS